MTGAAVAQEALQVPIQWLFRGNLSLERSNAVETAGLVTVAVGYSRGSGSPSIAAVLA